MKVIATKCVARDLKPGDLFSTVGPAYWDQFGGRSVGEKVYIRTETNAGIADDADMEIFRITIDVGEAVICGFCREPLVGGPRCSHCGAL